jgi:hypothetical protein
MGVGIPVQFHDLRPAGGLLDFINHQQSALGVVAGFEAGQIPLLLKPCLVAECGFVSGGVLRGKRVVSINESLMYCRQRSGSSARGAAPG